MLVLEQIIKWWTNKTNPLVHSVVVHRNSKLRVNRYKIRNILYHLFIYTCVDGWCYFLFSFPINNETVYNEVIWKSVWHLSFLLMNLRNCHWVHNSIYVYSNGTFTIYFKCSGIKIKPTISSSATYRRWRPEELFSLCAYKALISFRDYIQTTMSVFRKYTQNIT